MYWIFKPFYLQLIIFSLAGVWTQDHHNLIPQADALQIELSWRYKHFKFISYRFPSPTSQLSLNYPKLNDASKKRLQLSMLDKGFDRCVVSIIHRVLYVFLVSNWHICIKFITD